MSAAASARRLVENGHVAEQTGARLFAVRSQRGSTLWRVILTADGLPRCDCPQGIKSRHSPDGSTCSHALAVLDVTWEQEAAA